MPRPITLYHAPHTRSSGALILLEELGAPYTLALLNRSKEEHLSPLFRAVNPLGKVPALLDGDAVVTEQVAIFLHLTDLFPAAGLAPAITHALRGPYLRWMVFYAAAFEPAIIDRARGHEPGMRAMSPYGDFDAVLTLLCTTLASGPYLLGEQFSAADLLWANALAWTTQFKLVPPRPEIMDYIARFAARPAVQRARAKDDAMAAAEAG